MSRYLSEMLAFILLFLLILLMITGGEIYYDMSVFNSYRAQVVKIAQRSNGYNEHVRNEMNDLANDYYNNGKQHHLETEPINVTSMTSSNLSPSDYNPYSMVNYGHEMQFNIVMQIPTLMTVLPTSVTDFGNNGKPRKVSVTKKVKQHNGTYKNVTETETRGSDREPDIKVYPVTVTSQVRDTPEFPVA